MEVNEVFREERMSDNIFKEWKNMSPEQKRTEKFAIAVMTFIVVVICLLGLLAVGIV